MSRLVPGLAVAAAVAAAARVVHGALPAPVAQAVGEAIVAVLFGLILGNSVRLPAAVAPGIRFAYRTVLRVAIVLLGAGLSFTAVVAIGARALIVIVLLMILALTAAHVLGRRFGVSPRLATLLGVGTAVCGNSAIGAVAPAIGADDDEVAYAIATNTLFGTLAVFAYPILGHALGLSDAEFGSWAGTAVNDTSQVVAAGFAYSDTAGEVATVVKLTRNSLMGAVIVAMAVLHGRAHPAGGGFAARLRQSVPWFVVGFLVMAAIRTVGGFAWIAARTGIDVPAWLIWSASAAILLALAGVGLSTRFAAMRRTGLAPLALGLAIALTTATASYAWIQIVGPATG